jgi:hypothetical protein
VLLATLPAALALLALILQVRDNGLARHRLPRRAFALGVDRVMDWGRRRGDDASDAHDMRVGHFEMGGATTFRSVDDARAAFDNVGDASSDSKHHELVLTREGLLNTAGGVGKDAENLRVMISTTTADSLGKIIDWVDYHKLIGVDDFFIFVEGKAAAPEVVEALHEIPGVRIWEPGEELDQKRAGSRIWKESWLGKFFNKPCNNELFVRQSLNMEIAIQTAQRENIDWHVHIDTDELINPAGAIEYSVKTVFAALPADVDLFVFPNYEACPETDEVKDPFREVTLFKRNFDHVVRKTYMESYRLVAGDNPNYFLTYGNGKSAARVQDGLRPNGAHRFHNYLKKPVEMKAAEASVLHYTYTTFDDILARKSRCDCPKDEESLKQCFILEFDRVLYMKWDELNDTEMRAFYNERVVYRDENVKSKILSNGLFSRMYTPQLIVEGVRAARAQRAIDALSRGDEDDGKAGVRRPGNEDANEDDEFVLKLARS